MSRGFDRYMVQVGVGTNRKLRRLPVVQRWAYVAGVLSLAAQSPIRGALLIADGEPVTEQDVAEEATIPLRDAKAALASLRRLGMLDRDSDGVEWVHDWDALNPDPKPSDSPEATRERKRKERARKQAERNGGHANVTDESRVTPPAGHAPEVEEEGKSDPPNPPLRGGSDFPVPPAGGRARERSAFNVRCATLAAELFPTAPRESALHAVKQATTFGHARDVDGVVQWAERHFPDLVAAGA